MDIFAYADSIDWMADYYDFHTGYTYAIQSAPDRNTIFVYNGKECIGKVTRK